MEGFPVALFLASEESVFLNQKVVFDLVRPTKTGDGVESSAGLVNVIPRKRIYRMETEEELEIFKNELLRRPLVLQPTANYGIGSQACGLFFDTVNYVLLINQTHPKILGRIQMGVDAAKKAMAKETPFLLRFKFGDIIQREHYNILTEKYKLTFGNALDDVAAIFRFANWEHSELIVRYPGPPGSSKLKIDVMNIQFKFEDIDNTEIQLMSQLPYCPPRPATNPVIGDEIRQMLPGWTVNEVTPLEDIGETAPQSNYSYAQAGRLYESFRRKKPQKPDQQKTDLHPSTREGFDNTIELNEISPAVAGGSMTSVPPPKRAPRGTARQSDYYNGSNNGYNHAQPNKQREADNYSHLERKDPSSLYPNIQINDRRSDQNEQYSSLNVTSRDSDRSSYSTAASSAGADSGFQGNESDVYSNERQTSKDTRYNSSHHSPRIAHHENLAFRHEEDEDEILRKHKECVNKMLQQNNVGNDNRQQHRDVDYTDHNRGHQVNKYGHNAHISNGTRPHMKSPSHNRQSGVHIGASEMSESFI